MFSFLPRTSRFHHSQFLAAELNSRLYRCKLRSRLRIDRLTPLIALNRILTANVPQTETLDNSADEYFYVDTLMRHDATMQHEIAAHVCRNVFEITCASCDIISADQRSEDSCQRSMRKTNHCGNPLAFIAIAVGEACGRTRQLIEKDGGVTIAAYLGPSSHRAREITADLSACTLHEAAE